MKLWFIVMRRHLVIEKNGCCIKAVHNPQRSASAKIPGFSSSAQLHSVLQNTENTSSLRSQKSKEEGISFSILLFLSLAGSKIRWIEHLPLISPPVEYDLFFIGFVVDRSGFSDLLKGIVICSWKVVICGSHCSMDLLHIPCRGVVNLGTSPAISARASVWNLNRYKDLNLKPR